MIDIKLLRENPEKVKQACKNKNAKVDIDKVLELDKKKRGLIQEIESMKAEQHRSQTHVPSRCSPDNAWESRNARRKRPDAAVDRHAPES